jgi:uncharacterized protein YyaL (SSP411 family)
VLADAARDIFGYVLRDLSAPEGGFYSAEDADSLIDPVHSHEKGEGAFYIWTGAELREALGERDAAVFAYRFGVQEVGNVDEDPHGEFTGRNILYQAHTVRDTAVHAGLSEDQCQEILGRARVVLMEIRSRRPRPHLDDKILTGWNSMMISALAKGAQILDDPEYAAAARRALEFIRAKLWEPEGGRLIRRYRDGESAIDGFLDDYALLIGALIDMYETSFESADLEWAKSLAERACELFEDRESGGFFSTPLYSTPSEQKDVLLRLKDDYDGAEPSANSVMALALLRLTRLTGATEFAASAERTLHAFASRLRGGPSGLPQLLVALSFAAAPPMEIVLAGPSSDPAMGDLLRVIRERFLPNAVTMRAPEAPTEMPALHGRPTVYVCENYACQLPVTEPADLGKLLEPRRLER